MYIYHQKPDRNDTIIVMILQHILCICNHNQKQPPSNNLWLMSSCIHAPLSKSLCTFRHLSLNPLNPFIHKCPVKKRAISCCNIILLDVDCFWIQHHTACDSRLGWDSYILQSFTIKVNTFCVLCQQINMLDLLLFVQLQ